MKRIFAPFFAAVFLALPATADDTLPADEQVCTSDFALCHVLHLLRDCL